jgi:hypothetical protein
VKCPLSVTELFGPTWLWLACRPVFDAAADAVVPFELMINAVTGSSTSAADRLRALRKRFISFLAFGADGVS